MKTRPKPRKITTQLLDQIKIQASRGLSQQQICHSLGISETWWYDAKQKNSEISDSFKRGQAKVLAEVSNAIYEQALSGSTGAACFFFEKPRSRSMFGREVRECCSDQRRQNDKYTVAGGVEV